MKKSIRAALAILIIGIATLPGCFFYAGHGWHDRDRDDDRWEHRHDDWHHDDGYYERHSELAPQEDRR